MAAIIVNGVEGVRALPIGEPLGQSGLYEVTQEAVNRFADATGDHQWIHVDPERAPGTVPSAARSRTATSRCPWSPASSRRSSS